MHILDNTVLSNFAHIRRPDLLRLALPEAAVVSHVLAEMETGVASGRIPSCNWHWLTQITLSLTEQTRFEDIKTHLGIGEAASLAVALERNNPDTPITFFSDDRDARHYAQRHNLTVSGTLGVLALLITQNHLTLTQANTHLQEMIACGYHAPVASLDDLIA